MPRLLTIGARMLAARSSLVLHLLALAAVCVSAGAQQSTGRVIGRVIDATTGTGLTDVGVQVVGTTIGTTSGIEGRFTIAEVPAGTVTLHVRRIGYQPKTITGILLDAGTTLEQHVALDPAAVTLTTQVVSAAAERGTVSER